MKPNLPYYKKNKTDSRNSSPRGLKSPRYGTTEFFNSLEIQIKRVDPDFYFSWGDDSPLTQAINCVKQVIDSFLSKSQSSEFRSLSKELSARYPEEKSQFSSREKEELKKDLSIREDKLNKDKEKLRKMKKTLFELEDELKNVKEELNKEFLQLSQSKNKFRSEKEEFELEKLRILEDQKRILEAKLDIDQRDLEVKEMCRELDREKELMMREKMQIEKSLWIFEQENEKYSEKLDSIYKARELILLDYKYLEKERTELLKQKIGTRIVKKEENLTGCKDLANADMHLTGCKASELNQSEIEKILNTIQQDLQKAEKKIVQRSIELDDREAKIKDQEKNIKNKLIDLKNIKETLVNSSRDLNELISITFPKIQSDSKYSKQLLNQLSDTQKKLDLQIDSGCSEQIVLEGLKDLAKNLQTEELEKILRQKIEDLIEKEKKTEEKMAEVLLREKNVRVDEYRINEESEKLRDDHGKRLGEIEEAKMEMKILQGKLDSHLEIIEKKERRIFEVLSQLKKE